MRGRFITFEGPEGGGKSTHIQRLAGRLRERGIAAISTREPGGTPLGETIRGLLQKNDPACVPVPLAELLMFQASRAQHVERLLRPALERGDWVLCDRFTDSTLAYQGYGRGLDIAELRRLNDLATGGLAPDLTLLLDVPVSEGMARVASRDSGGGDRIESEPLDFHERLRGGFLDMAAGEPGRFAVLDATADPDVVAQRVWLAVVERLLG